MTVTQYEGLPQSLLQRVNRNIGDLANEMVNDREGSIRSADRKFQLEPDNPDPAFLKSIGLFI